MGKEDDTSAFCPVREMSKVFAQKYDKVDHVGMVGSTALAIQVQRQPGTPLRTLIARESGSLWVSHSTDPEFLVSPARKRVSINVQRENGRFDHVNQVAEIQFAKNQEHHISSGSSSPRTFGTRVSQVTHKMRIFKKMGPQLIQQQERPMQLGALFARERPTCVAEENYDKTPFYSVEQVAVARQQEPVGQETALVDPVEKSTQPLKALIAKDLESSYTQKVGVADNTCKANTGNLLSPVRGHLGITDNSDTGNMQRSSITGATRPVVKDESQELRSLFAKDWGTQTIDEEDDFWDSGLLCGAVMRSCQETKRRLRSARYESPSRSYTANMAVQNGGGTQLNAGEGTSCAPLQDLNQQSPACGRSRLSTVSKDGPSQHGTRSSLGTLLAEEFSNVQTQSGQEQLYPRGGMGGLPSLSDKWSVPVNVGESSRRQKIASLNDISTPVHSESQTQLEGLIAKILTLRNNSARDNASSETQRRHSPARQEHEITVIALAAENVVASTSDSTQVAGYARGKDATHETFPSATVCADSPTGIVDEDSPTESAMDIATSLAQGPELHPIHCIPDVMEKPSTSGRAEPNCPSVESSNTLIESHQAVSETGVQETGHGAHIVEDTNKGQMNTNVEEVQAPQVQLGTLLGRAWGEHGWLPLSRSQMGSSVLLRTRSSSSGNSKFDAPGMSGLSEGISPRSKSSRLCSDGMPPQPSVILTENLFDAGYLKCSQGDPSLNPDVVRNQDVQQSPVPLVQTETPLNETQVVTNSEHLGLTTPRERAPARVSLLTLLNQDSEMDANGSSIGRHLQPETYGCKDEEEDEQIPEQLDPMCCVCMVGHKGAAFIPCGHTFCRKCCREVRRSSGSCPLCNQCIADVLNIY